MVYLFWAHLAVWILVSFYIFMIQRGLFGVESRVASAMERLKEEREGETRDE